MSKNSMPNVTWNRKKHICLVGKCWHHVLIKVIMAIHKYYRIAYTLTVEKSDEFDKCMLNRQNFSYQNFTLRKFRYYIFYGYNLLT